MKILIEIEDGIITACYSEKKCQLIVVDKDNQSIGEQPVEIFEPEEIDIDLLYLDGDEPEREIRSEIKRLLK